MEISNAENLWELFGVTSESDRIEIDSSYVRLRDSGQYNNSQLRAAWKVLRDPYFSHTYENYRDLDKVYEAGFFDDLLEPEDINKNIWESNWLTTPVYKIRNKLEITSSDSNDLAVLLSTGSFSPIHSAHIDMMNSAKKVLEDKYGVTVLGGYISLSHDGYVSTKYGGSAAQNVAHRIRLCEEAVSSSDWLSVDPWEGRYTKVPITYTDVIIRLDSYLKAHFPKHIIKIYYVFGSDNAAFARAFGKNGQCVCLSRPGYDNKLRLISDDKFLADNPKIVIADLLETKEDVSSTSIRKGLSSNMPAGAKEIFFRWKKVFDSEDGPGNIYAIRDDLDWATAKWRTLKNSEALSELLVKFKEGFTGLLKETFDSRVKEDLCKDVRPTLIDLSEQQRLANEFGCNKSVLNLDACTSVGQKLNLSRLFGLSDGQCRSSIITSRPFFSPLGEQLNNIPKGRYHLLDDDSATGFTYKKIIELLPNGVEVIGTATLLDMSFAKNKLSRDNLIDVVDLRDFLFGSSDAGLVVSLPSGDVARAPYLAPYVSLSSRAKIPPSQEINFSINICRLNLEFFSSLPYKILLSDTDLSFQKLMTYVGFKLDTPMTEICEWHLERLKFASM